MNYDYVMNMLCNFHVMSSWGFFVLVDEKSFLKEDKNMNEKNKNSAFFCLAG